MAVLAATFGLVIGALLGLVGGGGGILAVPALVYGLDQPISAAVPASLIVIGLASITAAAPRLRTDVHWRLAGIIGAAGIPTSIAGAVVNGLLPQSALMLIFTGIMVGAGLRMLRGDDEAGGVCELPDGGVHWRHCLPRAIGVGLVVGFLTGLLGVGGGFLLIPALVVMLGLRMPTAVATSLVIIVVTSAAGLVSYLAAAHSGGGIDWAIVGPFAAAAVIVSLPAASLARRLPAAALRLGFAGLVLTVAVFVATDTMIGLVTS